MSDAARQYELRYNVRFVVGLGDGKDGRVFRTELDRAVKFLDDQASYRRELRAYQILRQRNIDQINGFQIPRLLRNDDELRAIDMSLVRPPFVLDFVSSYTLDEYAKFAFDEDVLRERDEHWREVFG